MASLRSLGEFTFNVHIHSLGRYGRSFQQLELLQRPSEQMHKKKCFESHCLQRELNEEKEFLYLKVPSVRPFLYLPLYPCDDTVHREAPCTGDLGGNQSKTLHKNIHLMGKFKHALA